ncbi:hypothetical protein [Saccharopolyspora antimicrobica]|nr:hypothetical protein [Saccharopolyspora antimicrobica]
MLSTNGEEAGGMDVMAYVGLFFVLLIAGGLIWDRVEFWIPVRRPRKRRGAARGGSAGVGGYYAGWDSSDGGGGGDSGGGGGDSGGGGC